MKHQEGNKDLLVVFMPLNFSGLHTRCFLCSATTVGCFGFHDPACVGGLPINLLLLEPAAVGVASTVILAPSFSCGNGEHTLDVRHTLCGSHTKDCLPTTRSVFNRFGLSGVITLAFDSGRRVAMEALLLGWRIFWLVAGGGLTAMEPLLAAKTVVLPPFVDDEIIILGIFSLSSLLARWLKLEVLYGGTGVGGGKKLLILRRGILCFEGHNGGLLSAMVFFCAWFRDENKAGDWAETAAEVLVSCFSLVFLSSANWFSRSRTCSVIQRKI